MPANITFDLNHDGIDDISIEYSSFTWDGRNTSGNGIDGKLAPLNGSSILAINNEATLFLEKNDIVPREVELPLDWTNSERDLVSVQTSYENGQKWPDEWDVNRKNSMCDYLGVLIQKDKPFVGWVKIKINISSGEVLIIDKEFTSGEYIVIDR